MNVNQTVLQQISFQVSRGNPWWGLLVANEYLEVENPIRRALVAQLMRRGQTVNATSLVHTLILEGARACALPVGWHREIGSRVIPRATRLPTRVSRPVTHGLRRNARRAPLTSERRGIGLRSMANRR
jgi:hypothetical protein